MDRSGMDMKNLFTNQVYHMPDEKPSFFSVFKKGMVVAGSTVPFDGRWYWSGLQYKVGEAGKIDLKDVKKNFYQKSPSIVYRYDKEQAAKAVEQMKVYNDAFLEYFGKDFAVFKTGKEAADALFKKLEFQQKKILGEKEFQKQKELFRKAGLTAESSHPPEFLAHDGGIFVFHNPVTGEEMTTYFFDIKNILLKKGKGLTTDEIKQLQDFFTDSSVSKEALERLAAEFGKESFAAVFFIPQKPAYWFDFLLRKFKGKDFRRRYPNLGFVDAE